MRKQLKSTCINIKNDDFESILKETLLPEKCETQTYQEHIPNSFSIKFTCTVDDKLSKLIEVFNNKNEEEVIKDLGSLAYHRNSSD